MKEVNKELLKKAANNLLFDMNEDQYDTLLAEFSVILKNMELISKIPNIDNVEPMTFPFECKTTYLREDVPLTPLKREDALKNAKDVVEGQIRLPKVI